MQSPHDISFHAGPVYVHVSFESTVDDIGWSDSRRVNHILCYVSVKYSPLNIIFMAGLVYHSNQQWILIGQTVRGLNVYCTLNTIKFLIEKSFFEVCLQYEETSYKNLPSTRHPYSLFSPLRNILVKSHEDTTLVIHKMPVYWFHSLTTAWWEMMRLITS